MGLLSLGTPLPWDEAKKHAEHVRTHGITQFLHTWDRLKDRQGDELLWGDEVEYMVVAFDEEQKNAKLSLRQSEILAKLGSICSDLSDEAGEKFAIPTFHPEYGRYMLESTPGEPYTGSLTDLMSVEGNMRYRRNLARSHLKAHEIPLSFTSFPRLGAPGVFSEPHHDPANAVSSHSLFLPQEISNPHARFPTLTANIRSRRGSKVAINLPIFVDTNTPQPFIDPTIPWDRNIYPEDSEAKNGAALQDHIYMDAMGFGMGCCCLQLTFQACNVTEARRLYDSFVPIGPIMLALTAASPFYRGYIADVDCRWNVIAGSVDDRTEEERGLRPLKQSKYVIPKSRYDSVSLYMSQDPLNRQEYNDAYAPYNESVFDRLTAAGKGFFYFTKNYGAKYEANTGIDDLLAKHIAHLFIRDPLVIFSELIDQDDTTSMDHFENLQSTNWQTVRFKPPPSGSPIGWRVEFRSMEVQLTDFENAAFSAFFVLLSRAILAFDLNLYMPISKVDENMQTSQKRDAARNQKFYFRKNVYTSTSEQVSPASSAMSLDSNGVPKPKEKKMRNYCTPLLRRDSVARGPVEDEYELMTLEEIMLGKGDNFPGLLGLVHTYVDTLEMDDNTRQRLDNYLDLIKKRSNGSLLTMASWMRNYVRSHPAYRFDSVISQEINYDLMTAVDEIERGVRCEPSLLPEDYCGSAKDQGHVLGQEHTSTSLGTDVSIEAVAIPPSPFASGSLLSKLWTTSISTFQELFSIIE